MVLNAGLHKSLQPLQGQVPNPEQNQERFQEWWQAHHADWEEQLKEAIDQYRQLDQNWQFSPEQEQVLQRYYSANQLLLDCLHSNCEVTATIRSKNQEPLRKRTGYERRFAPESQIRIAI